MNFVNRPASGEIRQNNDGLCSGKALANFAEVVGNARTRVGQSIAAVVLSDCRAKALGGRSKRLLT